MPPKKRVLTESMVNIYLSNKNFRPFVGLGLSFYHTAIVEDAFYGYGSRNEQTVLGFYPRTGFDLGHFSLTIDWNVCCTREGHDPPISQGVVTPGI